MSNLHILVTRPEPQAAELCTLIREQGDQATSFPTIEFAPPSDLEAFHTAMQTLDQQDWLIFISPQAVRVSIPYLPVLPPNVQIAAVGSGTAKALHAAHYPQVLHPAAEWHSEGLLDLPAFQSVQNKKIAIIRGAGGREFIDQQLAERGAQITIIIAYERILPVCDVQPYLNLLRQRAIDSIVCTSFEGVRNLKILIGETAWPELQTIPVSVMSGRVEMRARQLGCQTIWVTQQASQAAILDLLAEKRKGR
jgi:uroporphyrinogen-III synthase